VELAGEEGRERGRRRHKHSRDGSGVGGRRSGSLDHQQQAKAASSGLDEKRKRSREYAKPEDIKLSPVPKRDPFTGRESNCLLLLFVIFLILSRSHLLLYRRKERWCVNASVWVGFISKNTYIIYR
jgi:hypothetical protein